MNVFRRYTWGGLVFAGPAFLLYTYFIIISIGRSFYYSLNYWDAISPMRFKGLANYIALFSDPDFAIVLSNTLVGLITALIIQVGMGLLLAYLIYRTQFGMRIYRALVYLPVVLAPAAIAMMFTLFFNSDVGLFNSLLRSVGLGGLARNWLSDKSVVFYAVLTPMIYQFIGSYVILLLAGMQSIPEEILESAYIDGAGASRVFRSIVIPMLWDIILMCIIMITTGSFKAFEHSYIMTWGGPGVRSAFMGVFMYNTTFLEADFGGGSAIAMLILVSILLFTTLFRRIVARFDY